MMQKTSRYAVPTVRSRASRWRQVGGQVMVVGAVAVTLTSVGLYLAQGWNATLLREASLPELEALVRREPLNHRALALLAVRRCEAGQYGAATLDWERAASAGERGSLLWRTWAATAAASGDRRKADAVLRLGIAREPDASAILNHALTNVNALAADAPPVAIADAIFPNGIQQAGEYYECGSIWNTYVSWRGRNSPAQSGFVTRKKWFRDQPKDPVAQKWWAEALLDNQRYAEAESELQKLIVLQPNDAELYASLGDALRGQNRHGEAGKAYQKSLQRVKDNRRALLGLGLAMLDKTLVRISVPLFERATRLYPDDADAWVGMGRAHYQFRLNFGAAIAAFERVKTLAPQRTDYYLVYASSLRGAGRYADAEAITRQRIAAAPEDAAAHYLLARLILQTQTSGERRALVEAELRESLRLDDKPNVKGELGQFLIEQNRCLEAIPLLEASLRADNKSISRLRSLAAALRQTGQTEQAKVVMQSLTDLMEYQAQLQKLEDQQMLHPDDIKIHRQMVALFERGGEMEKAAFHREAVRRILANPESARRTLTTVGAAMSRSSSQ